jgi:hypothetical protein
MSMNAYDNDKLTADSSTEELIYDGVHLGITMEQLGEWRIMTDLDPSRMLMEAYRSRLAERRERRIDEIF